MALKRKYSIEAKIRLALRRVWMYSDIRRDALKRASVGWNTYKCAMCDEIRSRNYVDVDHIEPVTPFEGIVDNDWGPYIKRLLYVKLDGLSVLCKECHQTKTNEERTQRSEHKKKAKKGKRKSTRK